MKGKGTKRQIKILAAFDRFYYDIYFFENFYCMFLMNFLHFVINKALEWNKVYS